MTMASPSRSGDASPIVIVGPSHVVRWQQLVNDGVLTAVDRVVGMLGRGGMPTWSQQLFDFAADAVATSNARIVMLVGDFRFGNGVLLEPSPKPLFCNGYHGILPEAMTAVHDQAIRNRAMEALGIWQSRFRGRISFLFWDLVCRQVLDRLQGRYLDRGAYRHPHWDLAEVQRGLGEGVIDMAPLLERRPMHDVVRVLIDASGHPSRAGYDMLAAMIANRCGVLDAFDTAVAAVENELVGTARSLALRHGRLLVTGRSIWLDTLMRCLGPRGVRRMEDAGIVLRPSGSQLGHAAATTLAGAAGQLADVVRVRRWDDGGPEAGPLPCDLLYAWQAAAALVIRTRGEQPAVRGDAGPAALAFRPLLLTSRLLELGPMGHPTHDGLLFLFGSIATDLSQR